MRREFLPPSTRVFQCQVGTQRHQLPFGQRAILRQPSSKIKLDRGLPSQVIPYTLILVSHNSAAWVLRHRQTRRGWAIEILLQSRELTKMLLVFQWVLVYYSRP